MYSVTTSAALSLHDVSIPFGSDANGAGLRDVSLNVARGERLVLLGPSGEGKTSLLRAVAGLTPIASGSIHVLGRDVTNEVPERRGAVYLHQIPVLFPHLTVAQNVGFPLTVRGAPARERETLVAALLERLGLSDLAARLPHALSGGQQHRVALARALAARPHVLLLDEPLAALDPVLRRDVRDAIRQAHTESDAGLLLVTHDLADATSLGDRIAIMLDRRIAQVDTAEALFTRPASRAVMQFLGGHIELEGTITASGAVLTPLGLLPLPADVQQSLAGHTHVVVGIRGEAVRCQPPSPGETLTAPRAGQHVATGAVRAVLHGAQESVASVSVDNLEVPVRVDALQPPAVGTQVAIHIDPRGLIAFPDNASTAHA